MNGERGSAWGLDFYDPEFLADPAPIVRNEQTGQWMLTRFADVYETLRDRRLGRVYHHRYSHAELGQPAPDPRWAAFHRHERWSIDRCRELGAFDLLADYAQRYSVAVVAEVLGVPRADTQRLLDWSHAIVKMYELSAPEELKARADAAAGEFIAWRRASAGPASDGARRVPLGVDAEGSQPPRRRPADSHLAPAGAARAAAASCRRPCQGRAMESGQSWSRARSPWKVRSRPASSSSVSGLRRLTAPSTLRMSQVIPNAYTTLITVAARLARNSDTPP